MNRRKFILTACSAALVPALAQADEIQDAIVRELGAQGYTHVKISRTWLGRLRFVATSESREREIIINARTGEILRDYWHDLSAQSETVPQIVDPNAGRRSGSHTSTSGSSSGPSSSGTGSGSTTEQPDGGSGGTDDHSGDSSSSGSDSGSKDSGSHDDDSRDSDNHDDDHDGGDDRHSDSRESDD